MVALPYSFFMATAFIVCFSLVLLVFVCLLVHFETGSHCVALDILELTMQTRLSLNSYRSACLALSSAEFKGLCHGAWSCMPSSYCDTGTEQFLNMIMLSLKRWCWETLGSSLSPHPSCMPWQRERLGESPLLALVSHK